jgi:predicted nuclease of predicted toxin-antitoxin system
VKPLEFPLLADENINPEVICFLRENGFDVKSIYELNLQGRKDAEILEISLGRNF